MPAKSLFSKPWYPFLLSVFFVLHGYAENFLLITVKDALLFLFLYIGISLALIFLFWLYFKNLPKAARLTFLVLCLNFFFGYIHDLIKSFFPGTFILKYSVILPVAFIVFFVLAIVFKKRKGMPENVSIYLNLLFCIFIVIDIAVVIKKSLSSSYPGEKDHIILSCVKTEMPDVYLIVPDEYAGSRDLADICDFDNSAFIDSLRQRGFFVANNSRSNYDFTIYSMASLLNMDYVSVKEEQIRQSNQAYPLKLIFTNKVTSSFKRAGYGIYNYSGFDISDQPSQNNNSFIPGRTSLFTSQTLVSRVKKEAWMPVAIKFNLRKVIKNYAYQSLRYNQHIYKQAMHIPHSSDTRPKFVYTHLNLPHFPYYYDENGNPYSYEEIMSDIPGNKKNYIRYIKYTNGILLKLLDEILQNNRTPPIIILVSDHGYRCYPPGADAYTFINFFSVYLPDKKYSRFNDSLTNVNVFRALFNTEFCQQLPMLKDTTIAVGY